MIVPNRDSVRTIAALHQQEGALRVVIGRIDGGSVLVLATETVYPHSGPAGLTGLAERVGGVDLVVRVLPPGLTVARVVPLPAAPDGDGKLSDAAVADALSLMAETDLPSAIPSFRRAAGIIKPGRGSGQRTVGLLTAWPRTAEADAGTARAPRIAREVCVSEASVLAVLAQTVGGVERAWTTDRAGGAMTILAAGERVVVRVARVPAGTSGVDARRRAIGETSAAAGLAAGEIALGDEWLSMEPVPESPRFFGETRSRDWVAQFGLAAAALAAFTDANPAVNGMVGLHDTEPKAKPPILQRVSEWAGDTRRAVVVGAVCVLLAIGVPIGASFARVRFLEKQIKDEKGLIAHNEQDEAALRFARAQRATRLPMTKLLADIAGACPEGVVLDSVEVAQGEPVSIRGLAPDTDKLSTFRTNLDQTKVFTDIATPYNNPGEKGVQFQMTAKTSPGAALTTAKPAEDYVATPLGVRLYGEAARGATPSHASRSSDRGDRTARDRRSSSSSSSNPSANRTSGRESSRDSSRDSNSRSSGNASGSKPAAIPQPLSDEDIAKLNRDQAMLEWTKRLSASKQQGLDDATKQRLRSESDKAKSRMQSIDAGGGQ